MATTCCVLQSIMWWPLDDEASDVTMKMRDVCSLEQCVSMSHYYMILLLMAWNILTCLHVFPTTTYMCVRVCVRFLVSV